MSAPSTGPVVGASCNLAAAPDAASVAMGMGMGTGTGTGTGMSMGQTAADAPALPSGFPAQLTSQLAWVGRDFADPRSYVYQLSAADLAEISRALAHFKALELDGEHVSCATFPLPVLGAALDELSREVHEGRGFCVVRGLQPDRFAVEDLTLVYLGVQAHIADQRARQDRRGNMLVHIVADDSSPERADHHRHSNKAITFHTEETGDVVGWLTRSTAATGGRCILASAYTVYNVLAAHRPDLLRLLARADWPFALSCRPVLFYEGGRVVVNFGRTPLLGSAAHPRPKHLPRVSARQVEALDAVEAIARATELAIPTQAGDMHFVNNLAILHRREGFADSPDSGVGRGGRRHLVRMRLRSSRRGWPLPRALQDAWAADLDAERCRVWHVEPMPDAFFPLRKYPN